MDVFITSEFLDAGFDPYCVRIAFHICVLSSKGLEYKSCAKHISIHCGISKGKTRDALSVLSRNGWIKAYSLTAEEAKTFLCMKPSTSFYGTGIYCEWCKSQSLFLESHHYPIPQAEGGTKNVSICSGCHSEFHHLIETKRYIPLPKLTGERELIYDKRGEVA